MNNKILLVDDSETVLMMEKMILKKHNFQFVTARDGSEAIERAISDNPDLILLDIMMPKLNGLDTCKRIREMEQTRAIPIIMVTTRGEEENINTAFENGCNDYVTKPIKGNELLTKIQNLLPA